MLKRYQSPAIAKVFSDNHRYELWLEIEWRTAQAAARAGLVPKAHADALAAKLPNFDIEALVKRALLLEETLKHDVIAFLSACEEQLQEESASLHFGLTSSDVVDTTLAKQLDEACAVVLQSLGSVLEAFKQKAEEHRDTEMVGRSHGMHGEPTTFGVVLAGHYAELSRQHKRLQAARTDIAFGKLSGAVGTFAHLPPEVEAEVLEAMGLMPEPLATQVVPRDRHAHLFSVLAGLGASIERFSVNLRHWQRSELQEAEEPFTAGQRGSSAMPHKRNPIGSENLCGVARLLRGYALAALEDVALWHERDISHSSVERVIAPDAFHLVDYALRRLDKIVRGLAVYPERMRANLESSFGLVTSQTVLLQLTRAGMPRQVAYGVVQEAAMQAWKERSDFLTLVFSTPEVSALGLQRAEVEKKAKVSGDKARLLQSRAFA